MTQLFRIELPYACGGLIVENCVITDRGAPIFNWMRGKDVSYAFDWVGKKHGSISLIDSWESSFF